MLFGFRYSNAAGYIELQSSLWLIAHSSAFANYYKPYAISNKLSLYLLAYSYRMGSHLLARISS
jgi:hypothetical protein